MRIKGSITIRGRERSGVGTVCLQVNSGCGGILRGGHEHLGLVGIEEADRLKRGQRVFAEVNGAILCIGDAHTVKIDPDMLGTKRADIDGLLTTKSAVIFYLYARHILQGIGNR